MVCDILYILRILGGLLEDGKRLGRQGKLFASSIIFFLIISGGCVKNAVKNVPEEEGLRDRIVTYWGYKVKEEFDKSYAFEDPLFRKKITMVNYIRSFNTARAKWVGAEVEDIKIAGDIAEVAMKIKLSITVSSARDLIQEAPINEKWVKVDGLWYHIPRKEGARQSDH